MLLTDSLASSAVTFVMLTLFGAAITGRLTIWRAVSAGLALMACFLMRDVTAKLCLVLVPLVIAAGRAVTRNPLKIAALLLAVFAPIMTAYELQKTWNAMRSGGEGFVTTTLQLALMVPLVIAQVKNPDVFDGDAPLSIAGRRNVKTGSWDDLVKINTELFYEFGHDARQISNETRQHFWKTWMRFPGTMLKSTYGQLRPKMALIFVRPLTSINDLGALAHPPRKPFAFDKSEDRSFFVRSLSYAPMLLVHIGSALAAIVLLLFFVTFPLRLLRWWRHHDGAMPQAPAGSMAATSSAQLEALAGCWVAALGYWAAYGAVHYETRYMMPVLATSLIVAAWHMRERVLAWNVWAKSHIVGPQV